jgi:hypothetical protein
LYVLCFTGARKEIVIPLRREFSGYRCAARSVNPDTTRLMIDPLTLFLHSSQPLRDLVERSDDLTELKAELLQLCGGLDQMRALMPSPGCVLLEDVVSELHRAPLHELPPVLARAG